MKKVLINGKQLLVINKEEFLITPELFIIRTKKQITNAIEVFQNTGSYKGTCIEGFSSNIKRR